MKPSWIALAVVLLATLAAGAYLVWRPTDESRIRAQLTALAGAVRIRDADAEANPIARTAHVGGELEGLFEPGARVNVPELSELASGHADRRELAELVAGAPRYVRTFDVDFTSVTVKLDAGHTTAFVQATANVKVVERDGSASQDRRAVDVHFVAKDGTWVIRTLTVWTKEDAAP
ncbi:MAG TPA: hypothetical protein VGL81_32520 [Polyangiaceae bacterium]|jgi:hypothetical protein